VNPLTTLLAVTAILALIVFAILIARKEPLLSFGIFWFFGNLAIESSILGLELVFEHRNYLPSMFAILALVSLAFRYLRPALLAVVSLSLVGALFCAWTFERNRVWADEITLYRDSALKSPAKARPHNNLGAALSRQGQLTEAIEQFRTALKITPDYADAHYNLGYALARQGNFDDGIKHLNQALRIDPENQKALNNLGVVRALQGYLPEAIDHFKAALEIDPSDADVHNNLGYAFKKQGELDAAMQHFSKALAIDPQHPGALNNRGLVLMDRGNLDAAMQHFVRALEISPDYEEARGNLDDVKRRMNIKNSKQQIPNNKQYPNTKLQ
jgi:Flp pilus assembly protein TadD